MTALAPLENMAKTAAKNENPSQNRTAARLDARAFLSKFTRLSRVRKCGHAAGGLVHVQGKGCGDGISGRSHGLQSCGSVWSCPVCASKIAYGRQLDLERGISHWADDRSGSFVLLTLTLRHHRGQALKEVWDGLSTAWRKYVSHRQTKETLKGLDVSGYHRTTEVTYGESGWHVHLHVLYFLASRPQDLSSVAAGNVLTARWVQSAAAAGFSAVPNAQDWKILRGSSKALASIAGYVTKGEYHEGMSAPRSGNEVAMEVTRADLKTGRSSSRTPFEILRGLLEGDALPGDQELWAEWESASKGRRQQIWSRGLRADLGLDDEMTDQDLADAYENGEVTDVTVNLVEITSSEWEKIARVPGRHSHMLSLIDGSPSMRDAAQKVSIWLTSIGVQHRRCI